MDKATGVECERTQPSLSQWTCHSLAVPILSHVDIKVDSEHDSITPVGSAIISIPTGDINPHFQRTLSSSSSHPKPPTPCMYREHGAGPLSCQLGRPRPSASRGKLSLVKLVSTSRNNHDVSMFTRMEYAEPEGSPKAVTPHTARWLPEQPCYVLSPTQIPWRIN